MSARPNNKEKDLFEGLSVEGGNAKKGTGISLPQIRKHTKISYENIILLAIGFVMSCIICFSLGVEKGRRDIGIRENIKTIGTATKEAAIAFKETAGDKLYKDGTYIIQLAAFKKIESAKDEQRFLVSNGYNADFKRYGSYYQVYIEGFRDKKEAEKELKDLKVRYKDAYIKNKK